MSRSRAASVLCAGTRDARIRGVKRVQVEPHLSPTGACSAEWVPIKPKTDPAFLLALVHALLFEHERRALDLPFLREHTASPYLIGPDGYYLRDPTSFKPLLWDEATGAPVPFDTPGARPALEGRFTITEAVTRGPDDEVRPQHNVAARTAFTAMADAGCKSAGFGSRDR